MAKQVKSLSWPDRLALINHYNPSDAAICSALNVTADELKTARDLEAAGTFSSTSASVNVGSYADLFGGSSTIAPKSTKPSVTTAPATKMPPVSATKRAAEPKKRGRKGSNIAMAFQAIPTTPTSAAAFAASHGVSLAVLRQSKRFDTTEGLGQVRVKMDKTSKQLMICRVAAEG